MRKLTTVLMGMVIVVGLAVSAFAATPSLVRIEGKLFSQSQNKFVDGNKTVIVRIKTIMDPAVIMWSENDVIAFDQGNFGVTLGDGSLGVIPQDVLALGAVKLFFEVDGEEIDFPLVQYALPYALQAKYVDGLENSISRLFITSLASTLNVGLLTGQVEASQIADNSILNQHIQGPISASKISGLVAATVENNSITDVHLTSGSFSKIRGVGTLDTELVAHRGVLVSGDIKVTNPSDSLTDPNKVVVMNSATGALQRLSTAGWDKNEADDVVSFLGLIDTPDSFTGNDDLFVAVSQNRLIFKSVPTSGGSSYVLPQATSSALGGIKVGNTLLITDGLLNVAIANETPFTGILKTKLEGIQAGATNYVLPTANTSIVGGVRIGTGLTVDSATGILSVNSLGAQYVLPIANESVLGGLKIGQGLQIDATTGVVSVDTLGTVVVEGVPTATYTRKGILSVGSGLTLDNNNSVSIALGDRLSYDAGTRQLSATLQTTNDFTNDLLTKLNGIQPGATNFVLASASSNVLGGIKVGSGLKTATDGTLSLTVPQQEAFTTVLLTKLNNIDPNATQYVLPTATVSVLGGVKVGSGLSANAAGLLSVNVSALDLSGIVLTEANLPTVIPANRINGQLTQANLPSQIPSNLITGDLVTANLPVATGTRLGAIKVGTGLTATSAGLLSVNPSVLDFTGVTLTEANLPSEISASRITGLLVTSNIPSATSSRKGGVRAGNGLTVDTAGVISLTVAQQESFTTPLLTKLNTIEANATRYLLPTANESRLGGLKIGQGLQIDATTGVVSVDTLGTVVVEGVPTATYTRKGILSVGSGLTLDNNNSVSIALGDRLSYDAGTRQLSATLQTTNDFTTAFRDKLTEIENRATNFTLTPATSTVLGGVKIGSGLAIDGGTGILTATAPSLSRANSTDLGLVKINAANAISIDSDGFLDVKLAANAGLSKAGNGTLSVDTSVLAIDAARITSGTLPLERGGTGATTAALARTALGLGTMAVEASANYATDAELTAAVAGVNLTGVVPITRQVNGKALNADITLTKADIGLDLVENTALSTWTGSNTITTVGTIGTGVWSGTALADAAVADNITLDNLTQITNRAIADTTGTLPVERGGTGATTAALARTALGLGTMAVEAAADYATDAELAAAVAAGVGGVDLTGLVPITRQVNGKALNSDINLAKTDIGLGAVENTALSTWTGSNTITTVGTIGTGTWQGTAIADAAVADNITLTNLTQITNRAIADTTGNLPFSRVTGTVPAAQLPAATALSLGGIIKGAGLNIQPDGTLSVAVVSEQNFTTDLFNKLSDADLTDLVDGELTGSKVGTGIKAANITDGTLAVLNGGTGAADAPTARTNLGLGLVENAALSTWAGSTAITTLGTIGTGTWQGTAIADAAVADNITLTNLTQITNRAITDTTGTLTVERGGTGATDAAGARTNLGVVIGTDVQDYDADLDDLADGTLTGSKVGTGIKAANVTDITGGKLPNAVIPTATETEFGGVKIPLFEDYGSSHLYLSDVGGLSPSSIKETSTAITYSSASRKNLFFNANDIFLTPSTGKKLELVSDIGITLKQTSSSSLGATLNFGTGANAAIGNPATGKLLLKASNGVTIKSSTNLGTIPIAYNFGSSTDTYAMTIDRQGPMTAENKGLVQLKVAEGGLSDAKSFIDFSDDDQLVGRLSGQSGFVAGKTATGVKLESAGADYAEYLERLNPDEVIQAGDVVGVYGGKITRSTDGAQRVMVVSSLPVVLGNAKKDNSAMNPIAFIGQVPVKVKGKVAIGDFIVASGADDGAAIAVAPENLTAAQAPYVVGQAWEAKSATVLGLVNVAILPIDHSAALASENAELKKEIEEIKLQIQEIKAWMSDKKGRK